VVEKCLVVEFDFEILDMTRRERVRHDGRGGLGPNWKLLRARMCTLRWGGIAIWDHVNFDELNGTSFFPLICQARWGN